MNRRSGPLPTITRRARNRAVLARQLLLDRADLTPEQAVAHLIGLQAQAPFPPYTGLWSRLIDFDPGVLGQSITEGRVVRTALMRSTVHLVTAPDGRELRPLLQPVLDRWVDQARGRSGAGLDPAAVAVAARALLRSQPYTGAELGRALHELHPAATPDDLAGIARNLLPLVQLPPRAVWGRTGRTVLALGEDGRPAGASAGIETLVRRFLRAFGPASVADLQKWSGLTRLGEVVDRLAPSLIGLRGEDGTVLHDLPDAPRPDVDVPAPARLIPEFDNLLIGYADPAPVMDPTQRARVFSRNGIISATALADGFVRATWSLKQVGVGRGRRTELVLQPLEPSADGRLTPRLRAEIEAEADRLLTWRHRHGAGAGTEAEAGARVTGVRWGDR